MPKNTQMIRLTGPRQPIAVDLDRVGGADGRITSARTGMRAWAPLIVSTAWLLGTFGLFWLSDLSVQVLNSAKLVVFVLATVAAFVIGYLLNILRWPRSIELEDITPAAARRASRSLVWSAWYFIAFGVALLAEFGATGLGSLLASIQDPALAYASKFEVYEMQRDTGRVSPAIQILTIVSVLSAVLVPFLVIYWKHLPTHIRSLCIVALIVYSSFFVYIGTMKGLGDIVILLGASIMIARLGSRGPDRSRKRTRRRSVFLLSAVSVLFAIYMASSQAARVTHFGTENVAPPSEVVAKIVGHDFATGLSSMVRYPTHGYLGLAYNLDTPFVWSEGLGSSPALTSYAEQYLGVDPGSHPSYPDRTESRTGWPSGMYWATIYPWLASDLTFPGTILLMGVLGWWYARFWFEATILKNGLSILIFTQMCIFIAYIPANNQIGAARPSLFAIATLALLYIFRSRARKQTAAVIG